VIIAKLKQNRANTSNQER